MNSKKAVIIVPTYNEKENISRLLPLLLEVGTTIPKDWDLQVLVVDDTSPDGTAKQVELVAAKLKTKKIHLLVNPTKNGLGSAYLKGMHEAFTKLGASIVFELDADLSHDPTRIPLFLEKIDEGYDFVLGSRYIKGGSIPDDWGLHRKFLSVFGNLVIMVVLTDFHVHDWTSGYRCIKREVYEAVKEEMDDPNFIGYTFQVAFLHKAIRKGFKVTEVPFHFIDRKIGKSKIGPEYIKNNLVYIFSQRLNELIHSRLIKFGIVGGIGFVINTLGLFIFSRLHIVKTLALSMSQSTHISIINTSGTASALGAECAIVSNFILNNLWTFADRKLESRSQILPKFIQFNLASFGSVLIQFIIVGAGTHATGSGTVSKFFWLISATLIGMVLNFIVYSKLIWRKK